MPATCPTPDHVRARSPRRPRASALLALVLALAATAALAPPAGAHAQVLKRGSRGAAVTALQRRLHVAADGVFGARTLHAVRRFQRRRHLAVDGIVGPSTAAALGIPLPRAGSARRHRRHRHPHRHRPLRIPAELRKIARCESGGDPHAISPGGTYRGKYQFDRQTWHAIGGHGDPAHASEREQDHRALMLLRARGTSPWPNCA
jgi:Transglycosylase-like domain/Putative peptidoglycan binding domain